MLDLDGEFEDYLQFSESRYSVDFVTSFYVLDLSMIVNIPLIYSTCTLQICLPF